MGLVQYVELKKAYMKSQTNKKDGIRYLVDLGVSEERATQSIEMLLRVKR
jgi:hypothetical protein